MSKEPVEKKLSRRDFIKGAAAGTVGIAAMGILGACTQTDPPGDTSSQQDASSQTPGADNGGGTPAQSSSNGDYMTAEKAANTKWSFEIPPQPVDESEIVEEYTHDIIVIGAGMAGLCTMCAAMEQGADVLMFSASTRPYSRGGSNHAIGSKYQISKGETYSPETAREIVKVEQTSGTYFMDKQKWARWVNNSAESVDWMIDKMEEKGLHVCLEPGYYDPDGVITVPNASHNFWSEEQPFGALFGAPMQAEAYASHIADMGGEIHYSTVAQYLVREDNNTGRVSAVVAKNSQGQYVRYNANKAVVMATGDFSRDPDMMAKYSPWAHEIFKDELSSEIDYDAGLVYNGLMPGDGHKMGLWVGAAWQKTYPNAPMINGGAAGPAHAVISNFWGLNMDIHGNRYMNECTNFAYGAMAVLQLPERTAYAVWDTAYAYTEEQWEPFGYCVDEENGIKAFSPEEYIQQWEQRGYMKADTIEDLVAQFDMTDEAKANAIQTINRYSGYAENGYDEEFQVNPEVLHPIKTGPFYASKTVGATFLTVCGGLRTNSHLQVCDKDDKPIEGLYNTGIMVGDFYANSYNFVMPGQNLGAVCCTLSYLLGRELAEL